MGLAYAVDRRDGEVEIVLAGEVDAGSADQLRDLLFDEVARRHARITVDVRGLVFIDSGGIGTLVAARRAALQHNCAFLVTNARGQVRRVFTVAGVLSTLTRVQSSESAPGASAAPGA